MRTSAQALRDAIASGAVEAWANSAKIQYRIVSDGAWYPFLDGECSIPRFHDDALQWRPAPTKRRIPFTQLTIPKGALWNLRNEKWGTALEYRKKEVCFSGGDLMTYGKIAETADYSTDGGGTWHPGSMEVES